MSHLFSLMLVSWRSKNMAKGEMSCLFLFVCFRFFFLVWFFLRTVFYLKKKKEDKINLGHSFLWDCCSSCGTVRCPQKWARKGPVWLDLYNSFKESQLWPLLLLMSHFRLFTDSYLLVLESSISSSFFLLLFLSDCLVCLCHRHLSSVPLEADLC